jgi:hypothetical protein
MPDGPVEREGGPSMIIVPSVGTRSEIAGQASDSTAPRIAVLQGGKTNDAGEDLRAGGRNWSGHADDNECC